MKKADYEKKRIELQEQIGDLTAQLEDLDNEYAVGLCPFKPGTMIEGAGKLYRVDGVEPYHGTYRMICTLMTGKGEPSKRAKPVKLVASPLYRAHQPA